MFLKRAFVWILALMLSHSTHADGIEMKPFVMDWQDTCDSLIRHQLRAIPFPGLELVAKRFCQRQG